MFEGTTGIWNVFYGLRYPRVRPDPSTECVSTCCGHSSAVLVGSCVFYVWGFLPEPHLDYPRESPSHGSYDLAPGLSGGLSPAGLPEGGRRKVMKAETQTSAFCYLVAALVNDGNRGEENRSCRVSTALWTISRKSCWLACSRAGSGFHTRASSLSPEKMWQNL